MADKRRGNTTHLIALVITIIFVLVVWRNSGCPGPPLFTSEPPGYLLILPGNASSLPGPYLRNALPPDDRQRLVDLTNFKFLINNQLCNVTAPLVLVLVHSDPRNVDKRTAIRKTWGGKLKVLFLLGVPLDFEVEKRVFVEVETYQDIIQGNFLDAYRNMTYKHVMGLKWTTYHCPEARYLLKTDDDVFVHPSALMHYLRHSLSPHGARRLILCQPFAFGLVRRSYRSKWRVSYSEYPGHLYPSYCPGWAVLYSPDVVFRLYLEAQSAPYFWIDDVFVTGLLAARANFARTALNDLVLSDERSASLSEKGPHEDTFLFGPPNVSVDEVYRLWDIVRDWGEKRELS